MFTKLPRIETTVEKLFEMSWNRGKHNRGSYRQSAIRLRDVLESRNQSLSDENQQRPPPGLRGREIGMWYAQRSKNQRSSNEGKPYEKKLVSKLLHESRAYLQLRSLFSFPDRTFLYQATSFRESMQQFETLRKRQRTTKNQLSSTTSIDTGSRSLLSY